MIKNIIGEIGTEVLEQGGSLVKQTAKQIAQTPSDLTKAAGSQVNPQAPQVQGEGQKTAQGAVDTNEQQQNQDIVKSLYGATEKPKSQPSEPQKNTQESTQKLAEKYPEKSPEEIQKMQQLRQQLHATTYYQKLTTPSKPKEEERPAEKVEKEKKMELIGEKEEEKKKPPPLAVERAQNKAERFRGVRG